MFDKAKLSQIPQGKGAVVRCGEDICETLYKRLDVEMCADVRKSNLKDNSGGSGGGSGGSRQEIIADYFKSLTQVNIY